MVTNQQCNNCAHNKVCAFKEEYLVAYQAVKGTTYASSGVVTVEDSKFNVSITCPHMMANVNFRSSSPLSKEL